MVDPFQHGSMVSTDRLKKKATGISQEWTKLWLTLWTKRLSSSSSMIQLLVSTLSILLTRNTSTWNLTSLIQETFKQSLLRDGRLHSLSSMLIYLRWNVPLHMVTRNLREKPLGGVPLLTKLILLKKLKFLTSRMETSHLFLRML